MAKKVFEMTWRQFHEKTIREGAEMGGTTLKEAAQCYPEHVTRTRHFAACFEAAKNNVVLSRAVLDSLTPGGRHRIFHDLPNYMTLYIKATGKIYIQPEARETYRKGIL